MSRRLYGLLVRLLVPAEVARRHGADMTDLFELRLRQAGGSPAARLRAWLSALWDLLRHGPAQRLDRPSTPRSRPAGWRTRMTSLLRDLRFALRMLRTQPLFTAVAVATLALGIGATTAMFSIVNTVLLQPLPYPDADRLVYVKTRDLGNGEIGTVTTPANFADWRRSSSSFAAMATIGLDLANLTGAGEARQVTGMRSAGSYLEVLGVEPFIGRWVSADDDVAEEPVITLSHSLWSSLFGDDREVVGRSVLLDGTPHTIVGVMPPGLDHDYYFNASVDFWSTSGWSAEYRANPTNHGHPVIARLAEGVGIERAQEELEAIAARLRQERPVANRNSGVQLAPMHEDVVADSAGSLRLLMGAVGLVLLIAAVNIANLLLARASAREREIAVRKALGATRGQLAMQVLVESLLLGMVGGLAGLAVAHGSLDLVRGAIGWNVPNLDRVAIDGSVLAFTMLVSLLTGLAFGTLPALRFAGGDAADRLRSGRGDVGGGTRAWSALVVLEVALAVVLLVGAGLLLRTFLNLNAVDPGFRTHDLMTFSVAMPAGQDADRRMELWEEMDAELTALPGVERVTRLSQLPSVGSRTSGWFNFLDRPVDNTDRSFLVPYRLVGDDYFRTLEIPMIEGRAFRSADASEERTEVVINETMRRRFWGDASPLGDRIGIGSRTELFLPPATVVGVAADVRNAGLSSPTSPAVYFPVKHGRGWSNLAYVVAGAGDADLAPAVRARVAGVEPNATVFGITTVREQLASQLSATRSLLGLSMSFALVGLAMAGIGVFGLLSFSVTRRMGELGIRVALGADARRIVSLVVGQALGRVALGAALGVVAALAAGRLLESLLYEVAATDPLTIAGVCAVLVLIALVASWLPARRATRADPTSALRVS